MLDSPRRAPEHRIETLYQGRALGDDHDAGTVDLTIVTCSATHTNTLDSGDILNLNDQGDPGSFT